MRKILISIVIALTVSSCAEEVVFNNPSVQGLKNNVFWRALQSKALQQKDGSIVIEAVTLKETLLLHVANTQPKIYMLENSDVNFVEYSSRETNPETALSTQGGKGTGKITVTEYDAVKKTISGTFTFLIPNWIQTNQETKEFYFSQGVFYKVPVTITDSN